MPELVLLAVVSLTAMGLLVFLFLKLNQTQLSLIQSLTQTNQSLLNQVRSSEVATLSGLQMATGGLPSSDSDDAYLSTDARELAAYYQDLAAHPPLGDEINDEDLDIFRSAL